MSNWVKAVAVSLVVGATGWGFAAKEAKAALIVDTGGPAVCCSAFGLGGNQSRLAVEFSVADIFVITDIEGFITSGIGGPLTIALRSDNGTVPGAELYSTAFTTTQGSGHFQGAHGLSWSIGPGTYWAAFEVRSGQNFAGTMSFPAQNPLPGGAVFSNATNQWGTNGTTGIPISVRISATPGVSEVAVPEPTIWALMILGFGAAGAMLRRHGRLAAASSPLAS